MNLRKHVPRASCLLATIASLILAASAHAQTQSPNTQVRLAGVEYAIVPQSGRFHWDMPSGRWVAGTDGSVKVGSITLVFGVRGMKKEFVLFVDKLETRYGVTFFKCSTGDEIYFIGSPMGRGGMPSGHGGVVRQLSPSATASQLANLFYTDETTVDPGMLVPLVRESSTGTTVARSIPDLAAAIDSAVGGSQQQEWRSSDAKDAVRLAVTYWQARVAQDLEPYFKRLSNGTAEEKIEAAGYLALVYHPEVRRHLESALSDPDARVQKAVAKALAAVTPQLK